MWSPIEVYAALDQRLVQMNFARTALPTIIIAALIPILMILASPRGHLTKELLSLWSFLPIILSITHRLFAAFIKDTTKYDRIYNVKADLPFIRRACITAGVVSAASFQYLMCSWGSLEFLSVASLLIMVREFQFLSLHLGAMFWLVLLFGDLKKARMIQQSWQILLAYMGASLAVMGPGATLLAGWAWREEVLATKRHWSAVTKATL